ncbi:MULTISPECIES: ATP-binding protein [unclassified Geodermatophilus]|uniref:ATP-binding protein n=1 Tax=unclassified Geodermatophilus TaxID=2637632 RepID=UPI003EF0756D
MARRSFPALAVSVPDARRFVSDLVADLPDHVGQTAALLVSELAGNAVRHADGPEIVVAVEHADGRLRVGVTDTGREQPVLRSLTVTDAHRRGLQVVAAFADRWGARRSRATGAKTVWFELTVPRRRPEPVPVPSRSRPDR